MNWLLNCKENDKSHLLNLVDNLAFEAGLHGAKYLLSSAYLDSEEFEIIRHAGFCVYGWEKFWRVKPSALPSNASNRSLWQRVTSLDQHEIGLFQRGHLSPTLRAVTPLADEVLPDFILRESGEIKGIAQVDFFANRGIIRFLLDYHIINPLECIANLITLQQQDNFCWYIEQQTGQDWLNDDLVNLAEPEFPRKELLIKYFMIREKLPVGILNHAAENSHADPVAPYIHTSKSQDNL